LIADCSCFRDVAAKIAGRGSAGFFPAELIRIDPFAFFDGVPENVVPDNLRSGVSQMCRYEPDSAWHAM